MHGGRCVHQERGAPGGRQGFPPASADGPEGEGGTGKAHWRVEALSGGEKPARQSGARLCVQSALRGVCT